MSLSTILFLSIPALVLFLSLNLLARELHQKLQEARRQGERERVLEESLRLDFTRESRTLKRVEVPDPAARILCVDDEEVVLDSFRKILVLDGYNVDTVETGQEALGLVQTRDYDFVFTDLKMPGMSGTEVAKSVKHLRPDIDVVIITGYATVESAVECMKHGAMDYVEKPFTEDELRTFTRHALIRRQDRLHKALKPRVHVIRPSEEARPAEGEFLIPGGVLISEGHCWASLAEDGTAKVGIDDFARKLLGRVDRIELPEIGTKTRAGEPLFGVQLGDRRARFNSPISGTVVRTNQALAEISPALEDTPYGRNWICMIEADDLDTDMTRARIGNAAVALFQQDAERFRVFAGEIDDVEPVTLSVGALARLDDAHWGQAVDEFFAR